MKRSALLFIVAAAVGLPLPAQEVGGSGDAYDACLALGRKADAGELTVALALEVLGGDREAAARTVSAILRHEWQELPDKLFDGLDRDPRAARRFLDELAVAPRPAARAWVRRQSAPRAGRSYDHRLLALAARSEPLDRAEARLLLESLEHEAPADGFYRACAYLSAKLADGLIGRIHALLLEERVEVGALAPMLDRLSRRGTKSLLGLAVTLPPPVAYLLLRHVVERRPEQAYERVDAALDGRVPLDPAWLAFAADRIDRPARVARVLQVMRDADDEADRELAFEALLQAGALDAEGLEVATATGSTARVRRVIARAANAIPPAFVVRWLQSTPEVVEAMAAALVRRPRLEPEVQRALLDLLAEVEVVVGRTPLYLLTAIVHGGDAEALARVWPLVAESPAWRDLLDRLGRREEPFVYELLLDRLQSARAQAPDEDGRARQDAQLDTLRLLLVARGDRRELGELVAHAPSRDAAFVRRCRRYAERLSKEQAAALVRAAFAAEDPEKSEELLEWAAGAQPDATAGALWSFWQAPPADGLFQDDLREVAARLLMRSGRREDLLEQLRAALRAGPLEDALAALPYEALNGMSEPLHATDLRLCAELLLLGPIADPAGEQRMVRRWPDGSFGFPTVQAVANRLRGADEVQAALAFGELVDELSERSEARAISRQRLTVFWRALARRPALQRALGCVTARLWSRTAADAAVSDGGALWLLALDAEQQGDFAAAAQRYEAAARELLRLPLRRSGCRWLLGERDPASGVDPIAALAAAPHRMRLLAARAAEDEAAAAAAAALVREFAGHDEASRATVSGDQERTGR